MCDGGNKGNRTETRSPSEPVAMPADPWRSRMTATTTGVVSASVPMATALPVNVSQGTALRFREAVARAAEGLSPSRAGARRASVPVAAAAEEAKGKIAGAVMLNEPVATAALETNVRTAGARSARVPEATAAPDRDSEVGAVSASVPVATAEPVKLPEVGLTRRRDVQRCAGYRRTGIKGHQCRCPERKRAARNGRACQEGQRSRSLSAPGFRSRRRPRTARAKAVPSVPASLEQRPCRG